ncbi:MAG: carbamoyl phosphate synthase small subunit, partial [Verrucomicrobiota bacterium]|nr:carbamoyl phosphate synthase small subunit [Verrucomicrobiota bacterium]
MRAILALEDGSVFEGQAVGARASACGEVCFNTSMTGYQEILTDPSYKSQIVTMTYPQIGNYGVNPEDVESGRPHVAGFVMRELSPVASSWRYRLPLNEYLELNGVPGIEGIDTRLLTKRLRVRGALNGFISTENVSLEEAKEKAANWPGLEGVDYVKEVTHKEAFAWDEHGIDSHAFALPNGNVKAGSPDLPASDVPIVAYDFGIKYNILRCLRQNGFDVTVVPATTTAKEVMKNSPAGIFL